MKTELIAIVMLGLSSCALATTYYVAPGGNDAGAGSRSEPFATIQHSADIMRPGDRCEIGGGLYRESVTFKRDGSVAQPMTFAGSTGQVALLSAADAITGWRQVEGNLYEAPLGWDLGMGENQVYIDGVWAQEARWPNITQFQEDYPDYDFRKNGREKGWNVSLIDKYSKTPWIDEPFMKATLWSVKIAFGEGAAHQGKSARGDSIYDCRSDKRCILWGKPRDHWVGTGFYSPGWWFGSGVKITGSWDDGDTVRFTVISKGLRWVTEGYFFGRREFIDKPHEWAIANGKILMLFAPGENPNTMDITAKRRVNLMNLVGRTGIEVKNLTFHGTGIQLDSATSCVVDNCHFKYLSHYQLIGINEYGNGADYNPDHPILTTNKYQRGIRIGGRDNKFINSSIEYSAACGLIMRGERTIVENNFFRVIGYQNSYASAVANPKRGDVIKRNTFDIIGRSAINGAHGGTVTLNHFKDCMATSGDGGALYTYGQYPLYMELSYNWFNNVIGRPALYLYCDAGAYAYQMHHNVFMPSVSDRFMALSCEGGEHFNNTWACPQYINADFEYDYDTKFKATTSDGMTLNDLVATVGESLDTARWAFRNIQARDFMLTQGSQAIDAGVAIPGVTRGVVGSAPDLGAYEYGGEEWVPGHTWGAMSSVAALWQAAKSGTSGVFSPGARPLAPTLSIRYHAASGSLLFDKALLGGSVRVTTLQGRVIAQQQLSTTRLVLDNLAPGMLHYHYRGSQGERRGTIMTLH
jgi:hypothetical protein